MTHDSFSKHEVDFYDFKISPSHSVTMQERLQSPTKMKNGVKLASIPISNKIGNNFNKLYKIRLQNRKFSLESSKYEAFFTNWITKEKKETMKKLKSHLVVKATNWTYRASL